ncbi:MAG: hypothetical protein WA749_12150 [Gelidibacter sp.]
MSALKARVVDRTVGQEPLKALKAVKKLRALHWRQTSIIGYHRRKAS